MRQIKTVIYTIALKMNETGRLCQHRWELNAGMLTAQCKPVHQFAHPECNYKIVSVQLRRWRVIQGVKTADTGDNPMMKLKREPTNECNRSMPLVCKGDFIPLNYGTSHQRWYCAMRLASGEIGQSFENAINYSYLWTIELNDWATVNRIGSCIKHFDCTGIGCFGNNFIASISQHSTANCRCWPIADKWRNQ